MLLTKGYEIHFEFFTNVLLKMFVIIAVDRIIGLVTGK